MVGVFNSALLACRGVVAPHAAAGCAQRESNDGVERDSDGEIETAPVPGWIEIVIPLAKADRHAGVPQAAERGFLLRKSWMRLIAATQFRTLPPPVHFH